MELGHFQYKRLNCKEHNSTMMRGNRLSASRVKNINFFQSNGEKKSQENDSQMLLESQENIFQNISSVFSQSSQSTDIGDFKELPTQTMDVDMGEEDENYSKYYDLRTRFIITQPKKKVPRTQKTSKTQNIWPQNSTNESMTTENLETEENSQGSVSMLQDCYEKQKNEFPDLMETCLDSELEINYIFTDEEDSIAEEVKENPKTCENSTQTDCFVIQTDGIHPKEKEITKHASFINCIVKLKTLLSSKSTPERNLWNWNGSEKDTEESTPCAQISKESVEYLLRGYNVQIVFRETVQALIQHLEEALNQNFLKIACCWKNSIYETAANMISQAVNCEVRVWRMVDLFLCKVIDSIFNEEDKFKNFTLEAKSEFVIGLCQSFHLSCTAVNHIIEKLQNLKRITRQDEPNLEEKLSWTYLTKNSYFLIQILEGALELLKQKIKENKIEDIMKKEPSSNKYNVLKMWEKHWNRTESTEKENKATHQWEIMVSKWCKEQDEILLHCIRHVPVLSMALERCVAHSKDILKICHPGMNE